MIYLFSKSMSRADVFFSWILSALYAYGVLNLLATAGLILVALVVSSIGAYFAEQKVNKYEDIYD